MKTTFFIFLKLPVFFLLQVVIFTQCSLLIEKRPEEAESSLPHPSTFFTEEAVPSVFIHNYSPREQIQKSGRLLAAPVLNQGLILKHSLELENAQLEKLIQSRQSFVEGYCSLEVPRRETSLKASRSLLEKESGLYEHKARLHLQWVRLWLEDRLSTSPRFFRSSIQKTSPPAGGGRKFLLESEQKRATELFKTVHEIRQERKELLRKSWNSLLAKMEEKANLTGSDCLMEGKLAEKTSRPLERLTSPVHLALTRFFGSLPPAIRTDLIKTLNRND